MFQPENGVAIRDCNDNGLQGTRGAWRAIDVKRRGGAPHTLTGVPACIVKAHWKRRGAINRVARGSTLG